MATATPIFIDTNILVYQFDHIDKAKQVRAQTLMEKLISTEQAVISSQVVQEFANVALNKFKTRPSYDELKTFMDQILKPLCQHFPSFEFYERALTLLQPYNLSFYDSLIVQAASDLGCKTLYSEDLQNGQTYGDVKVVNPFEK